MAAPRTWRLTGAVIVAVLALAALSIVSLRSGGDPVAATPLPERDGPRVVTSYTVPHVQHNVDLVPEVDAELRRRIEALPNVDTRDTIVSINGTVGLWLNESVSFTDPAATLRWREFAHLHPDGSLHVVLPRARAIEATEAKWAELHPWVGRDDFWDGMVMLYTPQTLDELEVTWELIVDSYNLVTGESLNADQMA